MADVSSQQYSSSDSREDSNTKQQTPNAFRNDGSFMEMFKKMQENQRKKQEEPDGSGSATGHNSPTKDPPKKPTLSFTSSQVELARRMAERQMAMQVAAVRELIVWFVPFTVCSYGFLYYGYRKTKSWVVMFPLIPITFALGYQIHYAYGNKTNQIKALSERIMTNEAHMMAVPEWATSSEAQLPTHQETTNEERGTITP